MMLVARPKSWDDKARAEDRRRAAERIRSMEQKHRGGVIGGLSLLSEGALHNSARQVSGIKRSVEPLDIMPMPGGGIES